MLFKNAVPANINYCWAELMMEEFFRHGVRVVCLSPGSRSAPLISAAGRHAGLRTVVHFDERALAFYAMALAASSGQPVVLMATSGTAGANFLPGLVEASKKKVPVIVITADRPPELQKTGAAQTVEQAGYFTQHVRWFFDVPCPTLSISPAFILTTVGQACSRAQGEIPGPVHLNFMFREPLGPQSDGKNLRKYLQRVTPWISGTFPYTVLLPKGTQLDTESLTTVKKRLACIKNGLILVGKLSSDADRAAVLLFAEKMGFPIFADISSGLRLGSRHGLLISYYDQILLNTALPGRLRIDGIIHFGGRMTSRRCYEFLDKCKLNEYIMVLNHPLRSDPGHKVSLRAAVSPFVFIEALLKDLSCRKPMDSLEYLREQDELVENLLEKFSKKDIISEPLVARIISREIPSNEGLFLSNSMPVRDMDMYAAADGNAVSVGTNRGASGIDGIIASALGFAEGTGKNTTLLIGDLAFFYDLNALAMIVKSSQRLVIVLINNDGGGIFSFLPIAQDEAIFERCLAAPHGLNARHAAALFSLPYVKVESVAGFRSAYRKSLRMSQSSLIEVFSNRTDNVRVHRMLTKGFQ